MDAMPFPAHNAAAMWDQAVSGLFSSMKRIVAIVLGVLVLLAAAMMWSVWRASQEPVAHTPGPLETGRTKLRAQFEDAKRIEAQTEQQDWNSPANLRALIQGHEQRIAKLKDNSQAAEIVAYDREAINRLEKRITELAEQQAAKAEAQAAKAEEQEAQP